MANSDGIEFNGEPLVLSGGGGGSTLYRHIIQFSSNDARASSGSSETVKYYLQFISSKNIKVSTTAALYENYGHLAGEIIWADITKNTYAFNFAPGFYTGAAGIYYNANTATSSGSFPGVTTQNYSGSITHNVYEL